jgi:hypothetical protein
VGGRQDQAAYKLAAKESRQQGGRPPIQEMTEAHPGAPRQEARLSLIAKIGYEEEEDAAAAKLRLDRLDVFEKVRPMNPKLFGNTHS